MAKRAIPHTELRAYLDQAIGRIDACAGVVITELYKKETKLANWDVSYASRETASVSRQCKEALEEAIDELQRLYDLEVI
jgi:hypothetical protein